MIEILKFIFSDFWIWLGTLFLIGAFGASIGSVVGAMRGRCPCEDD